MPKEHTDIHETTLSNQGLQRALEEDELLSEKMKAFIGSFAYIEFEPDGTIIEANNLFLQAVGYDMYEIIGEHHRMFCDPAYTQSSEYRALWQRLARGEAFTSEVPRRTKSGKTLWLKASYMPIREESGRVIRVVKLAQDITAEKLQSADYRGQIEAIGKSQAVIEFNLDGVIQDANENFLNAVGYTLDEVKGKHHRIFCSPEYVASAEYRVFWDKLRQGTFDSGEYKRLGKNGKEIWIQASYNPILDFEGKPFKVVKYATDITAAKLQTADFTGQIEAIGKSQAVIEFDLNGTIQNANHNFLNAVGYTLEEVRGKHHRIFCDPEYAQTAAYAEFWRKLGRGEYESGEYRRLGKGGREIWIQASYNPILDLNGKPFKVVKYASDITAVKTQRMRIVAELTDTSKHLGSASQQLASVSEELVSNSTETTAQSENASTLSIQVTKNIESTATGGEEMESSVREIAQNASQAAGIASEAVEITNKTRETVRNLGKSSSEIGQVVKLITSIAEQTNLLALNATIEAARAGEAGRGFAVVANEVKELAKETASATEEISRKISAIQAETTEVVQAIDQIGSVIDKVNDISSTIASAVEEQTATTSEMARAMAEAATGSNQISDILAAVLEAAKGTNQGATETSQTANQLAGLSENLKDLVSELNA